ncbi:MAG: ABC transporter ATP-binding protein [Calditrichaceae bacterium]
MPDMIVTQKLSKTFNKDKVNEVDAVRGVDMNIKKGEVIVLKGPSGSGKTTLMAVLGCMAKPTSGEVIILGNRVSKWTEKFLTLFRRQHIGFIFQNFNLISGLTAAQNIIIPMIPSGPDISGLNRRTMEIAESLNISHRLNFKIDTLSGGEAQRVAIARALITDPEIIMADEPTAHLDTKLSGQIMDIFRDLKKQGKTQIIATHDPLVYESDLIDRIICMRDGYLVEEENE